MSNKKFTLFVCNCGSSSLSCQVYACEGGSARALVSSVSCKAHRVGTKSTEPSFIEYTLHGWTAPDGRATFRDESMPVIASHAVAVEAILAQLTALGVRIDVVGHRFVHGGALFPENTLITPEVHAKLVQCLPLATIHNPNSLCLFDYPLSSSSALDTFVQCFSRFFHFAFSLISCSSCFCSCSS